MLVNRLNNTLQCQPLVSGGGAPPAFEFGNALLFDGVNDYVNTPTNSFANLFYNANGKYTVSFWIKPKDISNAPVIFTGGSASGNFFFELNSTSNSVLWGAASGFRTYTSVGFSVGSWNHFMITKTAAGDNGDAYLNGSLLSTYTGIFKNIGNISTNLLIGKYISGSLNLDGVMDEVCIWNGVSATAQNAIDLYNSGNGALASDVIASPTAYWRMNESGTDTTATDETGNYNGTLNNFPTSGMWVAHTPAVDADAAAFISAAAITGTTQQNALNQLVLDLKGTGSTTNNTDVWSEGVSIYPICPIDGSTATLDGFKYNLKDPSAFQVTWNNTPTSAQAGVTGNGSNEYGATGIIISDELTQNNTSLTISTSNGATGTVFAAGGSVGGVLQQTLGILSTNSGNDLTSIMYSNVGRLNAVGVGTSGVQTSTRSSTSDHKIYLDGSQVATQSTTSGTFPTVELYVLGLNNNGTPSFYDTRTFNFFFIGNSLIANQAQDLYDAITTYNTALGR